jgi:O-antigen/teichoic acid export membrane protein
MTASVIAAAGNILLNFMFIPHYGYIAAGYTTFVCYGLFALTHYLFMKRICRDRLESIKVFDAWFIILLTISLVLTAAGFTALYKATPVRYVIIAICMLGCVVKRKIILELFKNFSF